MSKRLFFVLVISVCMFGLSFHFLVEGFGGVQDHFLGHRLPGAMDSHEGDQFILNGAWSNNIAPQIFHVLVASTLNQISFAVPPPFHPPKSF
jgi:hypothetical protein